VDRRGTDAALAVGLVVLWSSGFVGAQLGTGSASATTLLAWRFLGAAVVLGLVVAVRRPHLSRGDLWRHAVLGVLIQVAYLEGVVTGIELGVPAGTAALVAATQPLLIAAAGPERTSARQRWGLAVGAATGELRAPADPTFWWAVGWTVVLSSFGGYGTYLLVLRRSGAMRASVLLYLTPPVTALWVWAMFGQAPEPLALPGAIAAAVGAVLVLAPGRLSRSPSRTRRDPCPSSPDRPPTGARP